MKNLLTALLTMLLCASPVLAHWEDPQGCDKMIESLSPIQEWTETFNGMSDDGRDYIIRKKDANGVTNIEEHHMVLPKSQWKDGTTPSYYEPVLSAWVDIDGDGRFEEFFLFPRGQSYCGDAMHFIWDNKDQTYKLLQTGKDHV